MGALLAVVDECGGRGGNAERRIRVLIVPVRAPDEALEGRGCRWLSVGGRIACAVVVGGEALARATDGRETGPYDLPGDRQGLAKKGPREREVERAAGMARTGRRAGEAGETTGGD